jgi:acyl carrier protein
VPAAVVALGQLPLTPNGKLDHRALPALDQARPKLTNMFVAPRTAEEEALAAIWADLLRLEQVGIDDNFFDLGGHSLLATQLISRTRSAFQIEVPLRAVFEKPTIRGLMENIEALRWAMQSVADPSVMSMEQRETGEL